MNQDQLKQKITEYFGKLPKEAQEVFSSMVWLEKLTEINNKYHLNNEQIETLATETTLVLLGVISVGEFQLILEQELKLDSETLEKIKVDINENILKTIKVELNEAFISNALSLAEEKYGGNKKLEDRFNSLPKEIQAIINESNYQITLYNIAKMYGLEVEQIGTLEEITTKVMLGIIHPDKLEQELSSKILIEKEFISSITKDVNEKILKPIIETLRKIWATNSQEISKDEKIPLPPYISSSKQQVVSGKGEKELPKQPEAVPVPTQPNSYVIPKPIEASSKEQVVRSKDGGEMPKNIIEEKLQGATVSVNTVSDHSAPKTQDPYHEAIE